MQISEKRKRENEKGQRVSNDPWQFARRGETLCLKMKKPEGIFNFTARGISFCPGNIRKEEGVFVFVRDWARKQGCREWRPRKLRFFLGSTILSIRKNDGEWSRQRWFERTKRVFHSHFSTDVRHDISSIKEKVHRIAMKKKRGQNASCIRLFSAEIEYDYMISRESFLGFRVYIFFHFLGNKKDG